MAYYGLFSWIYSFITALSVIMINHATRQFNPALTLLFSVLLSILYFHILNWNSISNVYNQLRKYWQLGFAMCFIVAIIWFCTFYSVSLTSPFSFIMVYFTVPAILSNLFLLCQNQQKYLHGLSVFILIVTLVSYTALHAHYAPNLIQDIQGMLLAVLGGLTAFAYRKISYHFHQVTQLSATQILAIRSYGIVFIAPFLIPLSAYTQFWKASLHGWLLAAILAILTFIIPIYCNQQGIQQSGVEKHSIITASCPIFAYILSLLFIKDQLLPFPKLLFAFAISTSIGLVLSLIAAKQKI